MDRPYIICHMTMSLDGKVTGEYLRRPEHARASEIYYEINRNYRADAYACGRITMEGSFTGGWYPDLSGYSPEESGEDFLTGTEDGFYAVAFDPHGRLGWKSSRIIDADEDPGYDKARIIEILTRSADPRYAAFLRSMDIPYIIAGDDQIDVAAALEKLHLHFGVRRLLLEGGSILNGAFQRAGVIDELSLVVDPVVGSASDKPLFENASLENYTLAEVRNHDGLLWLNYRK